ncbi:GH32 C-terminal domain-containing protein [Agilicoccus flavus]|uniref:GH32 C-terminal domain-containing protein n=1 Tax=Agilicoccus flavus TaxID=2775968 RepID=UPI001CF6B3FE|nr:GH32 C-terminal domain-containing protein [Agilicoccus flavus]
MLQRTPHVIRRSLALTSCLLATTIAPVPAASSEPKAPGTPAPAPAPYSEPFRPQYHYSPAKNWVNDPNGLVYYEGEYHLFYQHNPLGNDWGNMSWGHAVSRDLVHWTELPVAIPFDATEGVFSGSVVVDTANTSGFGRPGKPAMVAVYTSAKAGNQSQALAYSLDNGRTFTKYAENPVLDIGSGEFRDPKVFWHAGKRAWVMVVAKALDRQVAIYSSRNLKTWTHESDFGPMNATGGVWECPDLFPLPTPRGGKAKWVMIVNLNPGGPQGGSGAQYFVGDFDGTTFTPDEKPYVAPRGRSLGSFDTGTFGSWTATGTAFGTGPAAGNLPGQAGVRGWVGAGHVNSFHGGDAATGTLTSPAFRIDADHLNFLVGGGAHPRVPGAVTGGQAPVGRVIADFESTTWPQGWTATGGLASKGPAAGTIGTQQPVSGFQGRRLVNTFLAGDETTGTLTSPAFTVTSPTLSLLVGGGNRPMSGENPTAVNLLVDGKVVRTATGSDSEALNWIDWDLASVRGKQARIQIVDRHTGGWGHVLVDQIVAADAPAKPVATDTSVDLVVGGRVVRSTTGANDENLDWRSWDVRALRGKNARIRIVDRNTGGFGHILADQFTLSTRAATTSLQRAHWLDEGADHYAAVTWNDAPRRKRISIAWMNNWLYAGTTPTSPWRSSFTVPRELSLVRRGGAWALASRPVAQFDTLETTPPTDLRNVAVNGTRPTRISGRQLDLRVALDLWRADKAGVDVLVGAGHRTRIGVDRSSGELFIDRRASGATGFSAAFPAVHRAPLKVRNGLVHLRVLVDSNSVEVFADGGALVMSDLVFPDARGRGVSLWSEGGRAEVRHLSARRVDSTWRQ